MCHIQDHPTSATATSEGRRSSAVLASDLDLLGPLTVCCTSSGRNGNFLMQTASPCGMWMQSQSGPKITLDFCNNGRF